MTMIRNIPLDVPIASIHASILNLGYALTYYSRGKQRLYEKDNHVSVTITTLPDDAGYILRTLPVPPSRLANGTT